ncbi:MAG TPA: serine/threonine-protein kinase [Pirellulales bacterium]
MNAANDFFPSAARAAGTLSADDKRVVRALEDYAAAVEAGHSLDRNEFLARFPEIAPALAECLDGLDFVAAAAPELAHPAAGQRPGLNRAAAFWPADVLGDYRVIREIGRGGMGVVYEVLQVSLDRRVALKVLPLAAALDGKQLQRFKNEAHAAAQLHHQNIVPVYGVGCERGVHYYAMQFIDGQTLASLIGELRSLLGLDGKDPRLSADLATASLTAALVSGCWAPAAKGDGGGPSRVSSPSDVAKPVDGAETSPGQTVAITGNSTKSPVFFRTAANLMIQAANALEHAHGQGIIHRDVKPANMLADCRGNLWIADFGLARCQNQAGLTMTGDLMGTLRYMSPEQALARRAPLDHRTDIYSLGASLYELLTLEPIFDGSDRQELLRQIANEDPRRPRSLNSAIPVELETIVLKTLEKNPSDRYATAQLLADDLQRYLKDEPIHARPPTLADKTKKWMRRHGAVVRTALAMLFVLIVAVAIVATGAVWRLERERKATSDQLQLTQQAEAEATRRLYRSLVEQARANRLTRRLGQQFETLKVLAEATEYAREINLPEKDLLELRNEAIAALVLPDLKLDQEWPGYPDGSMFLDFDAELRRYARIDRQGLVHVCRIGTGETLHTVTAFGPGDFGPGQETYPLLSPDGRFLRLWRDNRAKVWDLDGAVPKVVVEAAETAFASSFAPNSRELAQARVDGSIELHDLTGGRAARTVAKQPETGNILFHPHQRRLALHGPEGIRFCDLDNGSISVGLPGSVGAANLAWHPSGERIAAAIGRVVVVWDIATGSELARMEGHRDAGISLAYNHAGDLLATSGWGRELRLWDARNGRSLVQGHAVAGPLRFSLDDQRLGVGRSNQSIQLWTVRLARGYRSLARQAGSSGVSYHSCTASPNLPLLAVSTEAGVGFWHLFSGEPLGFLRRAGFEHVLFESSGALLAIGPEGLLRWPVRSDPDDSGVIRIGHPEKLLPGYRANLAASGDGRVIASAQGWGGLVWRSASPQEPLQFAPHYDTRYIGVSPDGRWVATGSHWGTKVKIWDVDRAALAHELPIEDGSGVDFSPDGKWLATTGGGGRVWSVGTWRPGPSLGGVGDVAFSPDSRMLAARTGYAGIRLIDPATGVEFARLEDPEQDVARSLCFSRDGAQLASVDWNPPSIHVWDLRALREELSALRLDWSLPSYPPPPASDTRPLRLEFDE